MNAKRERRVRRYRFSVIALILLAGVYWSIASAGSGEEKKAYPEKQLLVTGAWLREHLEKGDDMVIVDVRTDKDFDGSVIPGAIRLPWSNFRYTDTARGIGGKFIGIDAAQRMLGAHGIARTDSLVLYDSVARDGGATSSYVFWVLDLLGHADKKILERGIDGWIDAGGRVVDKPRSMEPMPYQAPSGEIRLRRRVDGEFIRQRLGDPYYQILDVRSRAEYLGEKLNEAIDGGALKAGHIPTAVNIDYRSNWADAETKAFKSYRQLLELYRGLDPHRAVITYCHSARRGSFGYFTLRLMGVEDVRLYDESWFEWGNPGLFFPVETRESAFSGGALPTVGGARGKGPGASYAKKPQKEKAPSGSGQPEPKGGYVSCGG